MGLFDYFRQSGAGVVQDIQSITRTGAVAPPTTAPRVSTTAPSVSTTRRLPTLGDISRRITTGYGDIKRSIEPVRLKTKETLKPMWSVIGDPFGLRSRQLPITLPFYGKPEEQKEMAERQIEMAPGAVKEAAVLYAGGAAVGAGAKIGTVAARGLLERAAVKAGTTTRTGRALLTGSSAVEPTLGLYGGYETSKYILAGETPEERTKRTMDVGVGLAGAMYGFKKTQTGIDWFRVRGRTEIPIEQVADPRVLSGEQQFPTIRRGLTPKETIESFKAEKSPFKFEGEEGFAGYHVSGRQLGKTIEVGLETKRPTDVPGLYISPKYASTYFTRTGELQPKELLRTSIIKQIFGESDPLKPQITRQRGIDVGRLPPEQRYSVFEAKEYLRGEAEPGKAYLTPALERSLRFGGAPEAEAVIAPGTKLVQIHGRYYVKIGNRRVPIDEYLAERQLKGSVEFIKGDKSKATTIEELITSPDYYRPTTIGVLRRPSVVSSGLYPVSRRVSKTAFDEYYADKYGEQPREPYRTDRRPPTEPSYRPPVDRQQPGTAYRPPVDRRQPEPTYRPIEYREPEKPPYRPPTYRQDERPPYRPPTYTPPYVPPYKPPYTPPYVPPPTEITLKPEKGKLKKKIGYQDPRYWPQENPVADLWGMLGIKRK